MADLEEDESKAADVSFVYISRKISLDILFTMQEITKIGIASENGIDGRSSHQTQPHHSHTCSSQNTNNNQNYSKINKVKNEFLHFL